jgi:hypothetical protein
MEVYNQLISAKVLDNVDAMLGTVPQPQMLGGKRMRNYVLPGSTEYDFPASLSVGRMDGLRPATLAGEFWKDFGDGFPVGSLQPPKIDGGVRTAVMKPAVMPQPELKMPKGGKMPKALKKIGKVALPIVKELGMTLAKEGIKEGVKAYAKPSSAPAKGGRRKKMNVEEAKEELRESVKSAVGGRRKKSVGRVVAPPLADTADADLDGGALLRNDPSQFHSSVYPPALASYRHSFPVAKDAYGRGRAKLPKSGAKRNSARGAIVAEVMKKHGLSLPEASKFVKEKGLY